ncbi:hypothetical protein LQQ78_25690 (plasmid) [Escherichia coli]|nr:hypothetical protein [Escherichia coli]
MATPIDIRVAIENDIRQFTVHACVASNAWANARFYFLRVSFTFCASFIKADNKFFWLYGRGVAFALRRWGTTSPQNMPK